MRVFAWLGSLLVLLVAAAFVVPPFVDWNRFKTQFEAEATRTMGQRVEVRGATSARLLPVPSVTFTDVRVGPADAPHLLAASFAMDLEPAPLLKGDVVIRDMRLDAPRLNVRINENGQLAGTAGDARMAASTVVLDNITITDGVIRFVDARIDREVIIRDIDGTASADALDGPWRGEGMLTWQGERVRLTVSTGQWRDDGAITVRAFIEPQSRPFDVSFEGPLDLSGGLPELTGQLLATRAPVQSAADRIVFPREGTGVGVPLRIEADLDMTPDLVIVPAYEMEIGAADDPYTITGSGQVVLDEMPTFVLRAQGQQVDVARLETTLGGTGDSPGRTVAQRLDGMAAMLNGMPRVAAKGVVEIQLPAIVAGDTIVRDVVVQVRPVEAAQGSRGRSFRLGGLEAQLPGRTQLRADGVLNLEPSLAFVGDLALASSQPSGFSKWLGAADDEVISAMRNAGFEAKADIGSGVMRLDDLEIILDGARLKGSLSRRVAEAGRGSIDLTLKGEEANFDQLAAWAALLGGTNGKAVTAGHDLLVDLDVERAVYDRVSAGQVVAKGTFAADVLDVELLEIGDLAGVALSANGRLEWNDSGTVPYAGSGTIAVSAEAVDDALALLDQRLPDTISLEHIRRNAALYHGADMVFDITADNGALTAEGAGDVAGTGVDLSATVSASNNLQARLVLEADNASTMLAQAGLSVLADVDSGRGGLRFALDGPLNASLETSATLTMRSGYASANGALTFALKDGVLRPTGRLAVQAEASDLDPFIAMSGLPLPGFGAGHQLRASTDVTMSETDIALNSLTGTLAGSAFSGQLYLRRDQDGKPVVAGGLEIDALSGDVLSDSVLTDGQLFDGLSGAVDMTVGEVSLLGDSFTPIENVRGRLVLEDGDVVIDRATGRWFGGDVEGNLALARSGETDLVSGTVAIQGVRLEDAATSLELPAFMSGRLDASVSFETSAAKDEPLLSALTGSGAGRVTNGRLKGISDDTLATALRLADETADADLPAQAARLVRSALKGAGGDDGGLTFGETQISVAVAGGAVRIDNVPLSNGPVSAIGRGRYDLTKGSYEGRLDVTLDPAREAVVGATPALSISVTGEGGTADIAVDSTEFETFLNMRLAERREREFSARQASIAQRQRIADTVRLYQLKTLARQRAEEKAARKAEAERVRQAEQARLEQERIATERARVIEQDRAERRAAQQRSDARDAELDRLGQEALDGLPPRADGEPVLDFRSLGETD